MSWYNEAEREEREFTYATDADWDRAEACELGALHPDRCWILTDRDVWHRNPSYTGPPQPHPEIAQEELYGAGAGEAEAPKEEEEEVDDPMESWENPVDDPPF